MSSEPLEMHRVIQGEPYSQSASESNGHSLQYAYDADGQRVSKTVDGTTTEKYLVDQFNPTGYGQVLEQSDGSGALVRSFVLGSDVIAQTDGSSMNWLLYDGRGSTRAVTDATDQHRLYFNDD